MLKIYNTFTSFQEVPDELSLVFSCYGCPLHCYHCSWEHTDQKPYDLSAGQFKALLDKYSNYISCICFLGGEWYKDLEQYLIIAKAYANLKICLYSGFELSYLEKNTNILKYLDFVKVGCYIEDLGGLDSKTTNQKMIDLKTNQILNSKFWKE